MIHKRFSLLIASARMTLGIFLAYVGVLGMLGRIGILLERLIERVNTANRDRADGLKNLTAEVSDLRRQLREVRAYERGNTHEP